MTEAQRDGFLATVIVEVELGGVHTNRAGARAFTDALSSRLSALGH